MVWYDGLTAVLLPKGIIGWPSCSGAGQVWDEKNRYQLPRKLSVGNKLRFIPHTQFAEVVKFCHLCLYIYISQLSYIIFSNNNIYSSMGVR